MEWPFVELLNRSDSLIESIKSIPEFVVYRIYRVETGESYIGTAVDTYNRLYNKFHGHVTSKDRSHCDYVHKVMKNLGYDKFNFQILEIFSNEDDMMNKEGFYVEKYDSYNHGYNRNSTGKIGPGIGSVNVYNPNTGIYSRVKPSEVNEYLNDGWIRKSPNKGTKQMISPDGVFCQVPEDKSHDLLLEGYKYISFTKDTRWIFNYESNDYELVSEELANDLVSKGMARRESPAKGLIAMYNESLDLNIRVPEDQVESYLSNGFKFGNLRTKGLVSLIRDDSNECIRVKESEIPKYEKLGWKVGARRRYVMYNPTTGRQINILDFSLISKYESQGFVKGKCRHAGKVYLNNGSETVVVDPSEVKKYQDLGFTKFGKNR